MDTPIVTRRLRIRELPISARPHYRLVSAGAGALSDAELLALIGNLPSLDDAQQLLAKLGDLHGILTLEVGELVALAPGIGPARAARLKAAAEFGLRLALPAVEDRAQIRGPADAVALFNRAIGFLDQEELWALSLNSRNRVIGLDRIYRGSLNSSLIRVGEIFKPALRLNAASLIISHNHPSGAVEPSPEDVMVTTQVNEGARLLDLELLDHILVARGNWVSLRQKGLGGWRDQWN